MSPPSPPLRISTCLFSIHTRSCTQSCMKGICYTCALTQQGLCPGHNPRCRWLTAECPSHATSAALSISHGGIRALFWT